MFLGVTADVRNWTEDGSSYSLMLDDNPLTMFAELPDNLNNLWYSNSLCGVIAGALEMVLWKCKVQFHKDQLRGHDCMFFCDDFFNFFFFFNTKSLRRTRFMMF